MAGVQEVLTPGRDRAGRLAGLARQRIQALAAQQPQDHLLLAARDPSLLSSDAPATTFLTPDIIDLQRSNRVSGQNRVLSMLCQDRYAYRTLTAERIPL